MKEPASGSRHCVNCGCTTPAGHPQQSSQAGPATTSASTPLMETSETDVRADPAVFGPFAMSTAQPAQANGPVARAPCAPPAAAGSAPSDLPSAAPAATAQGAAAGVDVSRPWRRQQLDAEPDASDLIAQRMVQGWALLDQYCPRCSEVLIRNRERRIFCVRCDAYVVSPQERQSMGVPMPHTPPLQPASPAATTEVQEEACAILPAPAEPAVAVPRGDPLVSVQRTLLGKVSEIEAMISATHASELTKCRELMALLREVLQTLQALNEMHGSQ
ncbi:hypothetical protein DUNSADRAFT_3662 [Dunaliella salina]|uniref:Sjoegren syndrome/scleroderma autoantigen 1 n=1 Tax=Dunaliella salina TaxID=3046 RepID=A0ABQ7GTL6_DUNSA|nr:hypothetical protein DUNSADRAFT_3662 [Dunaliella salina]|eukprot:KAF5837941.1 hypothetical protein DUNSADRAFT_3662 [Dunaliella salina]